MDKTEQGDRLVGLIQKHPMLLLDLPVTQRSARYAEIQSDFRADAVTVGIAPEQADKIAIDMIGFVRRMVQATEASGGGQGGNA